MALEKPSGRGLHPLPSCAPTSLTGLKAGVSNLSQFFDKLHQQSLQQYSDDHPEKMLFAFVMGELLSWLDHNGLAEKNNRYVMLAAITAIE